MYNKTEAKTTTKLPEINLCYF